MMRLETLFRALLDAPDRGISQLVDALEQLSVGDDVTMFQAWVSDHC